MTILPEATKLMDVDEDTRAGRDPFVRIIEAVAQLKESKGPRFNVPFEPRPADLTPVKYPWDPPCIRLVSWVDSISIDNS